jgi:hypothetical protein
MGINEGTNNIEIFDNTVKLEYNYYSEKSESFIFLNKFKREYYLIINNYDERDKFLELYYVGAEDDVTKKDKNSHRHLFYGCNLPMPRIRGIFELNILLSDQYCQVYFDPSASKEEFMFKFISRTSYLNTVLTTPSSKQQLYSTVVPNYIIDDTEMKDITEMRTQVRLEASNIDSNLTPIVNILNEFFSKYTGSNVDQVAFLERLRVFDNDTIYRVMKKYFQAVFDDDSSNIDNINRDSIKAELVIIEYLRKKESNVDRFAEFLENMNFFKYYDNSGKIYFYLQELREKLKFAIQLREYENYIIQSDTIIQKDTFQETLNNISRNFFEAVFYEAKIKYNQLLVKNERIVNKQLIYSKISHFDIYLSIIVSLYNRDIANTSKTRKEKILISQSMMALFNNTFNEIIQLHLSNLENKLLEEYVISGFWLLDQNYLTAFETIYNEYLSDLSYDSVINNNISKDLHSYVGHLLYLYYLYYIKDKRSLLEISKKLLHKLLHRNPEKTLDIAIKYNDFHTCTIICYSNDVSNKLLEHMTVYNGNDSIIEYIIKLWLTLHSTDVQSISVKEKEFRCFEIFDSEYSRQLKSVIKKYPKLQALYDIYLASKSKNSHTMSSSVEELLVKITNEDIKLCFMKLYRIINSDFIVNNIKLNESFNIDNTDFIVNNAKNLIAKDEINYAILMNYIRRAFNIPLTDNFEQALVILIDNMNKLEEAHKINIRMKFTIIFYMLNLYKSIQNAHDKSISSKYEINIIRNIIKEEYKIFWYKMKENNVRSVSI